MGVEVGEVVAEERQGGEEGGGEWAPNKIDTGLPLIGG